MLTWNQQQSGRFSGKRGGKGGDEGEGGYSVGLAEKKLAILPNHHKGLVRPSSILPTKIATG